MISLIEPGRMTSLRTFAAGLYLLAVSAAQSQPVLLWGDTHVHTAYSADAFTMGNRSAMPDTTYRFARGEPVIHPYTQARVQIDKPLDFVVVADHAESLGVLSEVYLNGVQLGEGAGLLQRIEGWFTERSIRKMLDGGDLEAEIEKWADRYRGLTPPEAAKQMLESKPRRVINSDALESKTWRNITRLADEYYEPGEFTTFIGWEWSSAPGGANLHRVVMTSADSETAGTFRPFSADDSPYPEDLWAWLEETSRETGVEFIAIPHNSNISKGFMFAETSLRGEPMGESYAKQRLQWEPVVEVTQIKGDSETHPAFSPRDEFAEFETYRYTFDVTKGPPNYDPKPGDYIRSALQRGLLLETRIGVNPYRFGLIGATDAHTGLSTAEEDNFGGKFAADSVPENKGPVDVEGVSGWSMSAQGLAAVWAEENTREAILDAFRRREVYATTGPRIALQFYGGWNYAELDLALPGNDAALRSRGVPMGGELTLAADQRQAPAFVVRALRDPEGANLDRIQIVKGWLDDKGQAHEQVYDVAWSGGREPAADGKLPPVGNTVDLRSGRYRNSIGAASLATLWTDPDFDPAQAAFYYARVLQIPTARHLLLDAIALGMDKPKDGPSVLQERAYSSPIWYRPNRQ